MALVVGQRWRLELQTKVREDFGGLHSRTSVKVFVPGFQFHIYTPCLGACLALCLNTVLNVKALVDNCTQEMALVGAFFVIVKSSRTFVCSSSVDGGGWRKTSITLIIVTNNPAPAPGSPAYWPERRVCRGVSPRYLAYIVLYILYIIVYGAGRHVTDV